MDKQREEEFMRHIAAGTDPLTALAALPRDESPQQSVSTSDQWFSAIAWTVIAGVGFAVWLLLI